MQERFLKKIAFIFCVLLLLQECQGRPENPFDSVEVNDDGRFMTPFANGSESDESFHDNEFPEEQDNDEHNDDVRDNHNEDEKDAVTSVDIYGKRNSKRYAAAVVLIATGITAGFDIYKQVAGCKHFAPSINKNLNKAVELRTKFLEGKKQINTDWAVVLGKQTYLTRLDSNLKLIQAHISRMDVLQTKIVKLLDSEILNKFDRVKANVTNMILHANETQDVDPNVFRAKAMKAGSFALVLTIKLAPLVAWLGFSKLGGLITSYADRYVNAASKTLTQKIAIRLTNWGRDKYAKIATAWNKMITKLPIPFKSIKTKLKIEIKNSATQKKAISLKSKVTKVLGAGAAAGAIIAYEAFQFYKFTQQCKDKEKKSVEMVTSYRDSLRNITYARGNMTEMEKGVEKNYQHVFKNITSGEFAKLVRNAIKTANNAEKSTAALTQSVKEMQYFMDTINKTWSANGFMNYDLAEKAVNVLIDGFMKMNYKLNCVAIKLRIIKTITDECATGVGTFRSLWNESKSAEGTDLKDCIENQNYLSRQGVYDTIRGSMEARGKSVICVRNNKAKFKLTCGKWLIDVPNENITRDISGTTLDDIKYFISKCPLGSVSQQIAGNICRLKENPSVKSVSVAYSNFTKYQPTEILATWKACKLSKSQSASICIKKTGLYTLKSIVADYSNYDEKDVNAVYNNCKVEMTPDAKRNICFFYSMVRTIDHKAFASYIKLYGRKAVLAQATSSTC